MTHFQTKNVLRLVSLFNADVRILKDNLDILLQYFQVDPKEIISVLLTITKHNPCCKIIENVYRSTGSLHGIDVENFQDPKLMQNLSLMIVDLKEYLLQKRMVKLEFVSKEYLSNSIDYMRACKNYQSKATLNHLQEAIKSDNRKVFESELFAVSRGETVKYLSKQYKPYLSRMLKESEAVGDVKLDQVNAYWKQSNELVSEVLRELGSPVRDPAHQPPVPIDPGLAGEYLALKNERAVVRYDQLARRWLVVMPIFRRAVVETTPIKSLLLPKLEKRLPRFLTIAQMEALLEAPLKSAAPAKSGKKTTKPRGRPVMPTCSGSPRSTASRPAGT